jgi:signal peptidase I
MEPTLHCAGSSQCEGLSADRVLANRWIYRIRAIQRGDIVVIKHEGKWCGSSALFVKRVIAIPGDKVRVEGRSVRVNGELVTSESERIQPFADADRDYGATRRLASGDYFVVGDYDEISCDSRGHGPVSRASIVAKVVAIWSPLKRVRIL